MATNKVVTKVVADTSGHDSALRKSEAEVLRYSQRVKNANNEMRGLNTNLGKASSSMRTFIGSLGTGKIGSLTSSLQGLSSAFGGLGGNIGNITTSLAGMQGGLTSLINPYTAIAAAVVGAGTAFYNFNKELDATTRKVGEVLGVSRNIAIPIRNSIKAIADTYSVEFGEVLNSVNTLMSQFGISSEEALDIVSKGFKAMGDSGESILPLIQQFAPQFRDAGIKASELMAIIGNTRGGIFGEEGMAAIAMAGKNIKNMSKSTKESLQAIGIDADNLIERLAKGDTSVMGAIIEISNKLKELPPQSQEVGSALQNVFGKQGVKAGQELITKLGEVETDLGKMAEKTGEWGKAMDDLRDAEERMNNALAEMFGTANGGFDLITTKLKSKVISAFAELLDVINKYPEAFRNMLSLGGGALTGLLNQVLNIKKIIQWIEGKTGDANIAGGIAGGVVGGMVGGVGNLSNNQTNIIPTDPKPTGKTPKSKSTPKKEKLYDDTAELKVLKEKANAREKLNQILDKSIDKENQLADAVKRLNELLNSGKLSPRDQQKALDALTDYTAKLNEANAPLNKYRDNTTAMNDAIANATQTQKIFDSNSVETKASLTDVANAMGSIGGSLGSLGEAFKMPVLDAAGIIANAIATMIQGYATASAQAATLGPWAWIAFGMEGLAQLAMMISQINSMKFAEGGIVNGTRTIGDMNLARVNSGEMILNGKQQRNLFNIINSGALGGSDSNQTVHFRVSGNDLVGVLNNYNNKRSKAR